MTPLLASARFTRSLTAVPVATTRQPASTAAESDQQWIVARVAARIIDLHSTAGDRYPGASDHVQRLYDAGGEDGVERAFQNVREAYDDGGYPEFDDPVERLQS